MFRKIIALSLLIAFLAASATEPAPLSMARAQGNDGSTRFAVGIDPARWYQDHEIENAWKPSYLDLATGDPNLRLHGVYAWPFALDSIGWNMQSYQDYGGSPYFHHGMDLMKTYGTHVYNRSGGQVINVENYQPGQDLYWEVAVLDPDGYIWQYHHIAEPSIPQLVWDKWAEYKLEPTSGGFVPPDTYLGDIIEWPVWSFDKQFNHIHLNILAAGGIFVNGFELHTPLPDTAGPQIQGIGLLQNGRVYAGNTIIGSDYSLYVRSRDLILDNAFYLPPWKIAFSVDGGIEQTTWQFDTLPGGADTSAYLSDFYVSPQTCGNYNCRDYSIDLGFIPDAQFAFPGTVGQHSVQVTVSDYVGSSASQVYTYTVIGPPPGRPVWQDNFETDLGWVRNPAGTDTATLGKWERGTPAATYSSGPKQLDTIPSGQNDLVTGRLAGSNATSNDLDGGVTSIRSPSIALPAGEQLTLSFRYYLAHGNSSSSADYLRVKVVSTDTLTVFEELGQANNDDGTWAVKNVDITSCAGQAVYLLIEAADNASDSLVEAAIDNVVIVSTNRSPTAYPQSISTLKNTPLAVILSGSDPDGDPLAYTIVLSPTHGTLDGAVPNLTYTPDPGYVGPDSFSFRVSDGNLNAVPATISIAINTTLNQAIYLPMIVR